MLPIQEYVYLPYNYKFKNFAVSSGVGSIHSSVLPNQRYRFLAMKLYTASLKNFGTIINPYKRGHPFFKCFKTRSAAVERSNTFPSSTSKNESLASSGKLFSCKIFLPASDCREPKRK